MRPQLQKLAQQIEQGGSAEASGWAPGEEQAQWEANLSAEQREQVSEAQQMTPRARQSIPTPTRSDEAAIGRSGRFRLGPDGVPSVAWQT